MRADISRVAWRSRRPHRRAAADRHLPRAALDEGRQCQSSASRSTSPPARLRQPAIVHTRRPRDAVHVDTRGRPDGHLSLRHRVAQQRRASPHTPESEYSATVMPGGQRFSVIRVEKDSTQRLWSFAIDGAIREWSSSRSSRSAITRGSTPNNLASSCSAAQCARSHGCATGKSDTLARDIGRSLPPLPDKSGFSFVRRVDSSSMVTAMTWPGRQRSDLFALPRRSQDSSGSGPVSC